MLSANYSTNTGNARQNKRVHRGNKSIACIASLSIVAALGAASATAADPTVTRAGSNAGSSSNILDKKNGSQNLRTAWHGKAGGSWFTLDLGSKRATRNLRLGVSGNRSSRFDITAGNKLKSGKVASGTKSRCTLKRSGNVKTAPGKLGNCNLKASKTRYITVAAVGSQAVSVHGLDLGNSTEPNQPPTNSAAPAFADVSAQQITRGETLRLDLHVSDKNPKSLILRSTHALPGGAAVLNEMQPGHWQFVWQAPAGNSSSSARPVTITATNGDKESTNLKFTVRVTTATGGVKVSTQDPSYWQVNGQPRLLIGGSDHDSIFQWPKSQLLKHLDALKNAGGNYIRNTMNSRSFRNGAYRFTEYPQPFNRSGGKYDLDQWNAQYWNNLQTLLNETRARGIVVQLELWDAYSMLSKESWSTSAWNPDNNTSYSYANTQLRKSTTATEERNFFEAIPAMNNDSVLLRYQKKYIDKLLSVTRNYNHVLYQIDNESGQPYAVGRYWANYIQSGTPGKVYVTDSRRYHAPSFNQRNLRDARHPENYQVIDNPQQFGFMDLSQNGGNSGQSQYDNVLWYRSEVRKVRPRPINHVKTYQMDWPTGTKFSTRKAVAPGKAAAKLWRNLFAGAASVRFHRQVRLTPAPGLGLGTTAKKHIRSASLLQDQFDFAGTTPGSLKLGARASDEAYSIGKAGSRYAVYFTGAADRNVSVNLSGTYTLSWLNADKAVWSGGSKTVSGQTTLRAPGAGNWIAVLARR